MKIADQAPQFFDTLQAQQQQAFQGNQAALDAISAAWKPVLQTGVIPYGFSPAMDQLLQSNVIDTGITGEVNASNAAALRQQQLSGGANVLPTGASAQIDADIKALGQQKIAEGLQREKMAGYEQGFKNLMGGTQAELGIAGAENETGLASAANSAGNLALSAGAERFKENQANSMFSKVMGTLGAVGNFAKDISGAGLIPGFGGSTPAPAYDSISASGELHI